MTMTKLEKALFSLGVLIFSVSLYLFLFQYERLGLFFNFVSDQGQTPVARVITAEKMVRRKTMDSPEFQGLESKQILFRNDAIMTGENSSVSFFFFEGGKIDIGPDALVRIRIAESGQDTGADIILDVEKGEVAGTSPTGAIKIKKGGTTITLPTKPEESAESPKIECHVTNSRVYAPSVDSKYFPEVEVNFACGSKVIGINAAIRSDKGWKHRAATELSPDGTAKIKFLAPTPGQYRMVFNRTRAFDVAVPAQFIGVDWSNPPVLCNTVLSWNDPGGMLNTRISDTTGKIYFSGILPKPGRSMSLNKLVTFPKEMKVEFETTNHFLLSTKPLAINEARVCPVLQLPAYGAKIKAKAEIIFTWNFLSNQDQFLFEVAKDAQFNQLVLKRDVVQNFARGVRLPKGSYFWRVTEKKLQRRSDVFQLEVL